MSQRIHHGFDRNTTTVHAEGYGGVFVTSYTLDQGVFTPAFRRVLAKSFGWGEAANS